MWPGTKQVRVHIIVDFRFSVSAFLVPLLAWLEVGVWVCEWIKVLKKGGGSGFPVWLKINDIVIYLSIYIIISIWYGPTSI